MKEYLKSNRKIGKQRMFIETVNEKFSKGDLSGAAARTGWLIEVKDRGIYKKMEGWSFSNH